MLYNSLLLNRRLYALNRHATTLTPTPKPKRRYWPLIVACVLFGKLGWDIANFQSELTYFDENNTEAKVQIWNGIGRDIVKEAFSDPYVIKKLGNNLTIETSDTIREECSQHLNFFSGLTFIKCGGKRVYYLPIKGDFGSAQLVYEVGRDSGKWHIRNSYIETADHTKIRIY